MKINDELLKNVAMATGILAAIIMASNIGQFQLAYFLFLTSSTLWSIHGVRVKNKQLIVMNIVFTAINTFGLYNFTV